MSKETARELAVALFEATGISKSERVMYLIEDCRGTLFNGYECRLGLGILEVLITLVLLRGSTQRCYSVPR